MGRKKWGALVWHGGEEELGRRFAQGEEAFEKVKERVEARREIGFAFCNRYQIPLGP